MELKIEKLDNLGQGISYYNGKIFFVAKTLPNEIIDAVIIKEKTKYIQGKLNNIIKPSDKRIESECKYFNNCSSCNLRMLKYQDTLDYKVDKLKYLFAKLNLNLDINIVPSKDNYRNKVSLKVVNNEFGYYEEESNTLSSIKKCLNAKPAINKFLNDFNKLNLTNGFITIRCNYNDELLIKIDSKDNININDLDNHKIVGIIINDELIKGEDHFMEIINNKIYNVSINSFFQINNEINNELHKLITSNINNDEIVLDLYCGVGSLTIPTSINSKKVFGVDNSESNIKDALLNSKINKVNNIQFLLGDASTSIKKIKDKIDTIIIDPPRKGLDKQGIINIIEVNPNKIIYVSCDPFTLIRDLKLLNNYKVKEITLLDMFPYTYHIETMVVLEK